MGVGGKAIPAPEVAVARNKALTGFEQIYEARAVGSLHHADLGQAARKLRRRLNELGERLRAFRQRRIRWIDRGAHPAHGVLLVDRRVKIVAERRAKRDLVALLDGHLVDHRRPHALGLDGQKLHQRLGFGVEALHRAFGIGQRNAGRIQVLARRDVGGFRGDRGPFGLGDRGLRAFERCRERGDIGPAFGDGRKAGFDIGDFAFDPGDALGLLACGLGELVALGGEVGERAGQFAEGLFRSADNGIGLGRARIDAGAALGAGAGFVAQRLFFLGQLRQRRFGVGDERALARDVVGELRQPAVELGQALAGAGLLGVERVAGNQQALQGRGGARFGLAKRRHAQCRFLAALAGLALGDGGFGDGADAQILGAVGFRHLFVGALPAQIIERGLDLADFGRDVAVADCLAGLALERVDLAGQLLDHVIDPEKVRFRGLEAQLSLVTARVQAGNSGGLFEDAAALLGLGLDDLADAALMDESGRTRAGRSVGKQGHDVAGADLAAVDAVERAFFPFDPARDVERVVFVELRRRLVLAVVDLDRDFGGVARRPVVVAGEDDVVHLGGAHRLVRGFAHHPAQRLDQVRLAATVRPDHAGQARLDQEVGRLDEGFEADQP